MTPFKIPRFQAGDDPRLTIKRQDLSGGQNTRQQANIIKENQAKELTNIDITIPGERKKRLGSVQIADDIGNNSFVALHNFSIQGASDQLLGYENTNLRKWTGTGNWSAPIKNDFAAGQTDIGMVSGKESGLSPDDIVIIQNGTDHAFRIDSSGNVQDLGDTNTSPPITTVGTWFGNRFWYLKNDLLYYSDAYSTDYSGAFDRTSNSFRVPVGEERVLVSTRDLGIVCMGDNAIWALDPSATPTASDKPVPLIQFVGCTAKRGWALVGDDIYFFAQDGLRELKRTVQDKLQSGNSFPISFPLKDEFDNISWANISNLSMKYFDNKLFIAVPTGSSTYDVWIYYPAYNAFTILNGWSPVSMETYKVAGEERFYYGKQGDGIVYRGWHGFTDEGTTTTNGTAICTTEVDREEDFGQKFTKKTGGELEIEAKSVTDDNSLTISVSTDGGEFSVLGTMSIKSADAPQLPINLSFTLADDIVIRKKFHLDSLGSFRSVQIKIVDNNINTGESGIYSTNLITFPEEYENE